MKKAVKYIIITCSVALFLFLMLPFLVPPSLEQISASSQEQVAAPQIFTANPLTKMLSRIVRVLKRDRSPRPLAAPGQPNSEATSLPAGNLYAGHKNAPRFSNDKIPADAENAAPAANTEFTDEPLQEDDSENWVLIQQQTPDRALTGMHEINVKDTPYNRYVKQERLARTSPVTQMSKPAEVPDSKLAKLFRPITQFWTGKKSVSAPAASAPATQLAQAQSISPADNRLGRNSGKQVRSLPKAQEVDLPVPNGKKGAVHGLPKYTLTDLINPASAIRESSRIRTETAYQVPGDAPIPDMSMSEFQQGQQNQAAQEVTDRLRQHLLELSGGADPKDRLGETVDCDVTKGLISEGSCENGYDENDLAAWREANRQEFLDRTHLQLPPTQLTPILGVADSNTLPQLQEEPGIDEAEHTATKELYRFMLEHADCSAQKCFWVANSIQQNKEIPDTFTAAGVDFAGDPSQRYDKISEEFTAQKLAELPPDATEEQRQEIANLTHNYPTPWVLYEEKDIQKMIRHSEPGHTLYISSAADTNALLESVGYTTPISYGKQAQSLTETSNSTLQERAHIVMTDLADGVIFMQGVIQDMQQQATQEAIGGRSSSIVRELQEKLANEQAAWRATHSGQTQK